MGLDITAYEQVELIKTMEDVEKWEDEYWMKEADGGIKTTHVYASYVGAEDSWGYSDDVAPNGVYSFKSEYDFRAGSYGSYNGWRAWLSQLVLGVEPSEVWGNADAYRDKPFYYLIHFSDCEGVIGPKHSKILSDNFEQFQALIDVRDAEDWLKEKYADWRKAFRLAADNGFVSFH